MSSENSRSRSWLPLLSLRVHLLVAVVVACAVPLIILTGILQKRLSHGIVEDAKDHTADVVTELSGRIQEIMESVRKDLSSIQSNPLVIDPEIPTEERKAEMIRLLGNYDDFFDISVYNRYGDLITSTNQDGALAQQYRDHTLYFKDAVRTGQQVVSHPKRKLQRKELFMDVYYPVLREGETVNVIKASLKFNKVHAALSRKLWDDGHFVLLDGRNNRLFHPDWQTLMEKHSQVPFQEAALPPLRVDEERGFVSLGGEDFIYCAKKLSPEQTQLADEWTLIGYLPYTEAKQLVQSTKALLWGAFLVVVIGACLGGHFLARYLARPMVPLARAAKEVIDQKWSNAYVPPQGPREIQEVARSFNQMVKEIESHQTLLNKKVDSRTKALRQKQAELADAVAKMEASFQSSREGILVVSPKGEVQTVNRSFLDFFDYRANAEEVHELAQLEKYVKEKTESAPGFQGFTHPIGVRPNDSLGERSEVEWHIHAKQERYLKVYCVDVLGKKGEVRAFMWVFRDITEARRLETSLQQAQKMEAVGRLAGGIAHDFNNLLTGIMGNLDLCVFEMEDDSPLIEHLSASHQAAQRAADLVKQLLGFSRQSFLNRGHFTTNNLVEEVANLLRPMLDHRIMVHKELASDCWGLHVDSNQINQVLMNLCVNARDAMEDRKDGQIKLSTRNVSLTEEEAQAKGHENAKAGDYVVITVADNGSGIPPEVLERIYEPFFTTKGQGKGTGLGLATSLGIIAQHEGWMDVDTAPGQGTSFHVFLPRDTSGETAAEEPQKKKPLGAENQGTGTVLLVDDEVTVRMVAKSYLRKLGYDVITAVNGQDGLDQYLAHRDQIDAAMLDLTMPEMTGDELFARLKEEDPSLPVVIYSGYLMEESEFANEYGMVPEGFLCKPFQIEEMAQVMKKAFETQLPQAA